MHRLLLLAGLGHDWPLLAAAVQPHCSRLLSLHPTKPKSFSVPHASLQIHSQSYMGIDPIDEQGRSIWQRKVGESVC